MTLALAGVKSGVGDYFDDSCIIWIDRFGASHFHVTNKKEDEILKLIRGFQ